MTFWKEWIHTVAPETRPYLKAIMAMTEKTGWRA